MWCWFQLYWLVLHFCIFCVPFSLYFSLPRIFLYITQINPNTQSTTIITIVADFSLSLSLPPPHRIQMQNSITKNECAKTKHKTKINDMPLKWAFYIFAGRARQNIYDYLVKSLCFGSIKLFINFDKISKHKKNYSSFYYEQYYFISYLIISFLFLYMLSLCSIEFITSK